MTTRPSSFMDRLAQVDPEFHKAVSAMREVAHAPGAIDAKTKTLITLAIDAAGGHDGGVRNLARRARAQGATDQEIIEVVRLAYLVEGTPALIAGLAAFEE